MLLKVFVLFVSWIFLVNYVFMTPLYSVTTNCGFAITNISYIQPRDGSQIFEFILEHSVLDPYIDILPNITYKVLLRTTIPGIKVSGFLLEIKENETSSTSLSDSGSLMIDRDMTVVDNQTVKFLSKNSSRLETVCNLDSSVMWTPRNLKRCYSLRAILMTNESVFYTVSTNVCRASGRRSYFLADIRGDIESPGFPNLYPDNYNATYILFSIHKLIHLQFQSFNLESSYRGMCFDAVSVISDKTDILCGALQTADLQTLYFVSTTGKLTVTFSTDNKIGHSGFRCIYFTEDKHECNRTLSLTNDNITSIDYPQLFVPWMYCVISIRLPSEFRIQLTIRDIDIPMKTNGECLNDSLKIISGNIIDTLCGNLSEYSSEQLFYQSSLSEVDIIFSSNYLHEGRGFWIEYSSHVSCSNKTFVNTSGNVYSDNFPNKYSNNQDCFYTIELSKTNGLLELVFESFYTETVNDAFLRGDLCNLDYLEIYIDDKVERICGQWKGKEHTLSFRTETNMIMLRFVTNNHVTRSGFFATWQNILQNITVPQCSSTWIEREEYLFEIVRNPLTWEESQTDCQHKGGYLAAITDMDTQLMLETYLIQSQNCTLELDAFWIGANDIITENHFMWVNGHPVEFEYWFPGWQGNEHSNKQPSDDGFSDADCVEIRRTFHNIHKGTSEAEHFFWNDRKCSTRNPYICQISRFDVCSIVDEKSTVLPPTVQSYMYYLNLSQPDVNITSPGFPEQYPKLSDINYTITVPSGYNIAIKFHHFNIESSDSCIYDNLTLASVVRTDEHKTTCGDWNTKLKKMTWVSETNIAILRFRTDKSIYWSGFSLTASIYRYDYCDSLNGTSFYLKPSTCIQPFLIDVTYPKAFDWCGGLKANLWSNLSVTAAYLISNFAVLSDNQAVYTNESIFIWSNTNAQHKGDTCEVMQIVPARGTGQPIISVQSVQCDINASFVCAWSIPEIKIQNSTVNCTSDTGEISMIKDDSVHYDNNRVKTYRFQAPKYHRIVLEITFLDLEYQSNCLYDALIFRGFKNVTSLCGNMTSHMPKYLITLTNNASITFRSDESVLGDGFHFKWTFVNTINCFDIQSYGNSGIIKSLNFRKPFMDERFCCSDINTPTGSRVILQVSYSKFSADESCVSIIYTPEGKSKQFCGYKQFRSVSETIISSNNSINLCLNSKQLYQDDGFQGNYYIDYSPTPKVVTAKQLQPNSSGEIVSPHYPDFPPLNIVQITSLIAPIGYRIDLNMSSYVRKMNGNCSLSNLEIIDDTLGKFNTIKLMNSSCASDGKEQVVIQSNLNKLKIIFKVGAETAERSLSKYSATFSVKPDIDYLLKTEAYPNTPFAECSNKSCLNGGHCQNVSIEEYICHCPVHFTGMFCQVSWCDLPVCQHGTCVLGNGGYSCDCDKDYWGVNCEITSIQCAAMVCSGNGVCIVDTISGKPCSCNKEWTGQNCSIYEKPHITTQSKRTLMDEPIWIGMITVLLLLILFGLALLTRRRCSRYFKCCEDTDEILKKQAENAIPAHKNYTPSTQGTPTGTSTSATKFKFEEDSSNFLKVESQNDMEPFHTPPIDVENYGAAVRLFDAYKSKSEKRSAEKQLSILGYENQQSSGIVDGTLQFLQLDNDILSSDNETYSKFIPFSNPELRKSLSSLPSSQKERNSTFVKSNSVQADFSGVTHCYPHIVIVNDTSYENLDDAENGDIPKFTRERKKSIQRQKTLDDLDAQRKREVFASKPKTSSTMLDIPPFESHLAQRRTRCNHELARKSPSITPTSFESDPTYRCNRHERRRRIKSGADSSEDEIDRYMNRSFCSQPDRLQEMVNECKCCGIERVRPRRPKYLRLSRKKTQQREHSFTSERSSSGEIRRHRRHPRVSSLNDFGNYKRNHVTRHVLSIPNESSEPAKRVSLHIMEENQIDNNGYRKMPVRKSRSNDLNLNKTPSVNQVSDNGSPFRKRSQSFHSETSDTRKTRNPDDLLNNDQKAGPSFYLANENQEQEKSKTLKLSTVDLAVVSTSSALSVTDTDTGFSSSSPWRETTDENVAEKLRIHSLKDSAYQTKQSSVERHPYEGPTNSYEKPEDVKLNDRIDMTTKLQQAARRLIMYEKNSQFSKDSAFTNTFSENEDTDSDKSPRELHPPLRPRTSNFSLHPKLFPLEQVSEEGDSHTPESATINGDNNTQSQSVFTEDIEMKEFVV